MKCPVCQRENPEDARFCNLCGYNLQEPEQIQPIDVITPQTSKVTLDTPISTRGNTEGERKRLTMLFADLSGYTAMNERIDPEEVKGIMRRIFSEIGQVVTKYDGFVDRFFGDEIMIVFGIPKAHEDDPVRAVRTAMEIHDLVNNMSPQFEARIGQPLRMHIGINTGLVVTGDEYIGKGRHGLTGDAINLAARLTKLAQAGETIVGSNNFHATKGHFTFESLKPVRVKGKKEPVDAYKLGDRIEKTGAGMDRQIYSEMLGREKELDKLELQVMKAISSEGSIINVIGEAGIGKSRLISELRSRDVMKRVTLLEGRAISTGRNLSFHPIINLLKHWSHIKEEDTSAIAISKLETAIRAVCPEDTNEIFPFVATLMGMKLSGRHEERIKGIEGEALEKLILKNVRNLLIKSTELTPLVIVIEDLHWADTSSIELLESLFRLSETQQIMFINVFRPDHPETGDRIIETIKEKLPVYYVEINLQPLNEQLSETLINNMLNIKGLQRTIVDQIILRSGGNPFFIEEVVRSFIDKGAVVRANGEFKVTEKIENMVIPYTINDVLMARIDRLDENTRDLVKVASVIGRSFFYRILTEVANTVDGIDNRLSYLKQIELIRERQRMEELEYLFKHALAQEAAYESILHQKRKNLHLEVAHSIEKVFDQRLHEFYGMLALHYMKGEDFEKAEHYLVKAGDEALRSSASSEALNYYQEGLKLYLQANQDTTDPEKLAMFEKNIAVAFFNKLRAREAVEHIDKIFDHWKIHTANRVFTFIKFIKNAAFIMTGVDILIKKKEPSISNRDNEILDLLYKKCGSLAYYDNIEYVFAAIDAFNRAFKIDIAKSPEATNFYMGLAANFSMSGLSFKLPKKLLQKAIKKIDTKHIQSIMLYKFCDAVLKCCSGYWKDIGSFEEKSFNKALDKGELFNTIHYIMWFGLTKSQQGHFQEAENCIKSLYEVARTYGHNYAHLFAAFLEAELMLKKYNLYRAKAVADKALTLSKKDSTTTELAQLLYIGYKAECAALLNNFELAKDSIHQANIIIHQEKFLLPVYIAPVLSAQFVLHIQLLKNAMASNDRADISKIRSQAHKSGKKALIKLKKYAPYRTKTFTLMGEYYWLIGKQNKALKWWDKAVKKGEELGARPELSRTYFEIGKRLLEPDSKYKELNGITAEEYLDKAKIMFEEMDLQWDLDELDKVMTTI